jgi:hypothetical protein
MIEAVRRNDPARCPVCQRPVERQSGRGRRQKFCSDACRQRAFRRGVFRNENARQWVPADSPQKVNFVTKGFSKNNGLEASKNDLEKAKLFWIEVNDVTWKLTDGEISRTPASYGQWGGYNTERALVWVIDVGWPFGKACWYVRQGDNSYGPTSLSNAKRAAESFLNRAPVPENNSAHSFIGAINLNAAAIRTALPIDSNGEWVDSPTDESAI